MPPQPSPSPSPKDLIYRHRDSLKVGELFRYVITYTPTSTTDSPSSPPSSLWLKVKNLESVALRAAYLAGPYILYVDVRSSDYDQNVKAYSSADQPSYEPQLKAGQSFNAQLFMNKLNSSHTWTVDVVSQIIFSPTTKIQFELDIGRTKDCLNNLSNNVEPTKPCFKDAYGVLEVRKLDTLDIWHSPTPVISKPLHLVIITHGLHSNTGADMLFVKEKIDEMALKTNQNIIVRGYFDNVCKTEKGIKYLGRRLGDHIMKSLIPSLKHSGITDRIKISFIGHSLGGLVQTFALAHIQAADPTFFGSTVEPENFIGLATPFLGLSNENPKYVKFVLDVGFAGKSGRDLGLAWKFNSLKKHHKPLLQILPTGPAHKVLIKFKHRTTYANSVNDGIVPLRTSSILYLDWKGISKAAMAQRGESPTNSKLTGESYTTEVPRRKNSGSDSTIGSSGSNGSNGITSDIINSVSSPLLSFFSFMAPQAGSQKHGKIYKRSQTLSDTTLDNEGDLEFAGIPKSASAIESGISVLVPPLPPPSFINDPDSRPETIFHDKLYRDQDLPPRLFRRKSTIFGRKSSGSSTSISSIETNGSVPPASADHNQVEKSKLEERLAREWHRGMTWRKVLVRLEPDAHNNIVVRRRFANAYGWPVIDHLVKNHFDITSNPPTPSPAASSTAINESCSPRSPFSPRHERLDERDEYETKDISSMAYEIEDESDREDPKSSRPTTEKSYSLQSVYSARTVDSTSSWNSNNQAWESHLKVSADDSDDDGIVGLLENMRGLGSLPTAFQPEDVSPAPLDDPINSALLEQ